MEDSFKIETGFIPETIDQSLFGDAPAQNFFAKWCEINDSITPRFISREEWEKRKRDMLGILEKNDQGEQTLFLPKDLHLWEMIDVIKTVDSDTFARNPERSEEKADEIEELGKTFERAGLYLKEYAPDITSGKGKIAQDIARDFYQYGRSLQKKERITDQIPKNNNLSPEEKAELDEWFLGQDAYQKRLSRLGNNPTEQEKDEFRKKLLSVFFGALAREGYKEKGKPWEGEKKVGPIGILQAKARRQIKEAIETPKREMKTAFFRRGVNKLVTEIKKPNWGDTSEFFLREGYSLDLAAKKVKLIDDLEIPKLKEELESLRKKGNEAQISDKELTIAKKIQKAVSSFSYDENGDNPSRMIEDQFLNCVGSSMLGSGLLDEVGINHLVVDLPIHSATVLITSDGRAYWQDFTGALDGNYTEITSEMIEPNISLSEFAENPRDAGARITFKRWNPYSHVNGQLRVTLFKPEVGLQYQVLCNAGTTLYERSEYEEAAEAFRQAISVYPEDADPYKGLGNALHSLREYEKAVEAYQKFIELRGDDDESTDSVKKIIQIIQWQQKM